MDDMNLGEEKKPAEVTSEISNTKIDDHESTLKPESEETPSEASTVDPKKPITRERSVEELSMSDDEGNPPAKKFPKKSAFVPKDKNEEKTTDVFKNLYSEFKEYIPSKDKKEETNSTKKKPGFMQTARGFFGL